MKELLDIQKKCIRTLKQDHITEVIYGGGAGSGKTVLGCSWIIEGATKYPGTRWLIGRSSLAALKATTLKTFFDTIKAFGMSDEIVYNSQEKTIFFNNGSEVILKDLRFYPKDPNFDALGSLEISGAFLDEIAEIAFAAWEIVGSRCRYMLKKYAKNGELTADLEVTKWDDDTGEPIEWRQSDGKLTVGIVPKTFGTCNPSKNWSYTEFYKADKEGTIKPNRAFIKALAKDNKYLPKSYIEKLLAMAENRKQRLYYGNWEYDDNPNALCDFKSINDIFTNAFVPRGTRRYITADIARLGSDKAVILVWSGWRVIDMIVLDKSLTTEIARVIIALSVKYSVPRSNIIADEDGVGGGVVDMLKITGFVNNSRALNGEQYYNLKTQCYYKLARVINMNAIFFDMEVSEEVQKEIIEELEQIESSDIDSESKYRMKSKDAVKKAIGRSPDYSDAMAMRVYFEIVKRNTVIAKAT